MNDRLPPIPTPRSQILRQLRLQYVPVVVFIAALITAALLWTRWVAPASLIGEAEAVRTAVRSAHPGVLTGFELELLQPVKAGQVLGQVVLHDPRVLEATLASIRAGLDTIQATMDPVVGQQRAALDLERLQLDLMGKRVDLAVARGQLHQAETILTRDVELHRMHIISDEDFDAAQNSRDTLVAQIKALTELIARLEPRLRTLEANGTGMGAADVGMQAAIKQKEAELQLAEAQLSPVPLIAPIDGVITMIHRRRGETVAAGDPILEISATRSEHIIGYFRQPLPALPKPGTPVEVRTRTFQRRIARATILQVGQQFEPITPTLLTAMRLPVSNIPTEYGLRVLVAMPSGLALKPGEHVDIVIQD